MAEKKSTFAQRVVAFLKGGDEAKINRLHKYTKKHMESQIKINESEIEELRDKLEDLKENKEDRIYNVNLDRIGTAEDAKSYVGSYVDGIFNVFLEEKEINEKIEEREEQIKYYQMLLAEIK